MIVVGTVKVWRGCKGNRAVGVDCDRAVRRRCRRYRQWIAIGIIVVGQHGDGNRCIFVGGRDIIGSRRRWVGDGIDEAGRYRAAIAITGGNRDGVDAIAIRPALRRCRVNRAADHARRADRQAQAAVRWR